MKTIQNPTNFFFQQSNNPPTEYKDQIKEFVSKLLNTKQCVLCKEDYNFTNRIPRILIHCGHTFCSSCLRNFYRNMRIRCPLCLKLIKNLEMIERLPVNHTIFTQMAEELNSRNRQKGEQEFDTQAALYAQFEQAQQPRKQQQPTQQYVGDQQQFQAFDHNQQGIQPGANFPPGQKPAPRIDQESGLEWCEYHCDRIKHFFCMTHKESCCRVCSELLHGKQDCMIVDLYEIEDAHGFLNEINKFQNQQDGEPQIAEQMQPTQQQQQQQQQYQFNKQQHKQNQQQFIQQMNKEFFSPNQEKCLNQDNKQMFLDDLNFDPRAQLQQDNQDGDDHSDSEQNVEYIDDAKSI